MQRLVDLDCSWCLVSSSGFKSLVEGLKRWNNIQRLNVYHNLGLGDTIAFAGELQSLFDLDCSKCAISFSGFQRLVEGLKKWNNIQKLDASFNEGIGDAIAFAGDLENLVDFRCLMCNVGSEGFRRLVERLKKWNKIRSLDVCFNKREISDIVDCMEGLKSLKDFICKL